MAFILQIAHLETARATVQAAAPLEACGLIAAHAGQSCAVYPIANILASPTEFRMDPAGQIAAMQEIQDSGWVLAAIFHSHPAGPETPSTRDLQLANYPEANQLIFSPGQHGWQAALFTLTPSHFERQTLWLKG